jgi:hypothetical protein
VRYFVLGAPPGRRGSAWTPGLPVTPVALKWGLWGAAAQLHGQPGTEAIRAPDPATVDRVPRDMRGGVRASADSRPVIYPSLYYVHGRQEHAPVSLFRTNNMPVPAVDVTKGPAGWVGGTQEQRIAQTAFRTFRVGGSGQTGWPATPVRWPWRNRIG